MKSLSVEEIGHIANPVDGWLGKREGPYLYSLAKAVSSLGVIVEIGSWKGKSTIWLAQGAQAGQGGEVYAIDPHVGGPDQEQKGYRNVHTEEEFKNNIRLAGVEHLVVPLVMTSREAVQGWNRPIGLLWVDGDHSYENVKFDLYNWEPYVVVGGVIAFHDTFSWNGVRKFVDEEVLWCDKFQVLGQVNQILAVRKVPRLSALDRMKRRIVIYLRQAYNRASLEGRHRRVPKNLLLAVSRPRPGN